MLARNVTNFDLHEKISNKSIKVSILVNKIHVNSLTKRVVNLEKAISKFTPAATITKN